MALKLLNGKAISSRMMGAAAIMVGLLVGGGAVYIGQAFAYQNPLAPAAVSGTSTGTFLPSSLISSATVSNGPVGPYTVAYYDGTFVLTGGIAGGLGSCSILVIVNPDGSTIEYSGNCTFTGTVTGGWGPGTMSVSIVGTGSYTTPTPEGSYQDHATFSGGTGGLRNIQSIELTDAGVLIPPSPPFNSLYQDAAVYGAVVFYQEQ